MFFVLDMYIRRRSEVGHVQSASNTFSVFLLIPRPGHLIFDISAAKHYCLRAYSCVLEKKMHRRLRTVFCPDILGCIGLKKKEETNPVSRLGMCFIGSICFSNCLFIVLKRTICQSLHLRSTTAPSPYEKRTFSRPEAARERMFPYMFD